MATLARTEKEKKSSAARGTFAKSQKKKKKTRAWNLEG